MTTTGNSSKGVVRLPQSDAAFFAQLKSHGYLSKFASGTLNRKSRFPTNFQQTIHYSYPGLAHGRPLNKVMIVLVGQSGAGKSTTINALFNDEICETSNMTSQTRTVTEYGKELCVSDPNSPSVVGTLSFVDPPGTLDVDQVKEAANFAIINKFRHQNHDLRSRKGVLRASSIIREHVYPNLVLMVVHGADNRMDGPDSNIRKNLRALDKYRLVDRLYPNLVVVVTHAMTIAPTVYKQQTRLITHVIQEAVRSILRIRKVQVVFVENKPELYNMVKPEGYDFYQLPDGRLSHLNLIRAMEKQFDATGDDLGKLLCGWYFSDDCPEKQNKANVLNSIEDDSLSQEETEEALQMLASLDMQLIDEDEVVPPKFEFQYLGHGYCPKTESLKDITVHKDADTVPVKLLNMVYTVPECLKFKDYDEDHFLQISFVTKATYEHQRLSTYGLEGDVTLVVNADSNGRWIKGPPIRRRALTRAVFEKRLLSACISNPSNSVKEDFIEVINHLPATYSEHNVECFKEFFSTYGSHFVNEVWLGGGVIIDTEVRAIPFTEMQGLDIHNKLRAVLKQVIDPDKGDSEYISAPQGSEDKHLQKCTLSLEGGDPPPVVSLAEFTAVRYADWIETAKRHPVEFQYSFKLLPYYKLVENDRRQKALKEATLQYLEGKMPLPTPPTTPPKRQGMFLEESGPKADAVQEGLKTYQECDEDIFPQEFRRNEVGNRMVKRAQISARESNVKCVIL